MATTPAEIRDDTQLSDLWRQATIVRDDNSRRLIKAGSKLMMADPQNYGRITYVVKDGEIIDRDRLPEHPILTDHGIFTTQRDK